jgi:hypothetical protein
MKKKLKRMRGGSKSKSLLTSKTSLDPLNLILVGVLIFIVYQMIQMNKSNPETVVREKIIYKTIDKEEDQPYREDIYKPDLRQGRSFPPFNIKTRGPPEEYDMVGFLQDNDDSNKLQQLYGRRTYPNSNQWNYFVKSDQYHQIPIPVSIGGQNCTDERGCKELNDKDSLNILNKEHTATIYKPEPYYYNPYSI